MALHLRGPLDRALAVFGITTTAAFYPKTDDTNGGALAVVAVNSAGTETANTDGSIDIGGADGTTKASAANPVPTTGYGFVSSATFTPAAAAYLAGDIMQSAQSFGSVGPTAGGAILITNTRLRVDAASVVSGETSYTLHLYTVTPPSALADNAAWDLPSGDRASYVGSIALGTVVDVGSTLYVEQTGLTKQITVPAGGSLFGYLVTNGAFTATAAARVVTLMALSA